MVTSFTSCVSRLALGGVVLVLGACTADAAPQRAAPAVSDAARTTTPESGAMVGGATALETTSGPVAPGTYAASFPHSGTDLRAIVEVPEGFWSDGTNLFLPEEGSNPGLRVIGFWTVAEIHADPCYGSTYVKPGPTVQDLATALADQPLRGVTGAPVPVSLGGHDGLYLELAVPDSLDVATCSESKVERWRYDNSDRRWQEMPGERDRVWILDVDGQRVVINAAHTPDAGARKIAKLTRTVESITFSRTDAQ